MSELLKNYSRQPKIYLKLPSGGQFYSQNPTEKSGSGELPVLSMTAKDELMMRTPDALMNGESVNSCIKSCIPMIDDPWDIPLVDLDAILVAIRIATYGENMKMTVKVPGVEDEELDIEIDLVGILDGYNGKTWEPIIQFNDLKLHSAPLKFKDQNETCWIVSCTFLLCFISPSVLWRLAAPLAAASSLGGKKTGNVESATEIGKQIAEKAKTVGVTKVAFDRSGYQYHGRVKALADAARGAGLEF